MRFSFLFICSLTLSTSILFAQGPQSRKHTANKSKKVSTIRANKSLKIESKHSFQVQGDNLKIIANGIPSHKVGSFPNGRNPSRITAQNYSFTLTSKPQINPKATSMSGGFGAPNIPFGIALNGVLFDPGTAEYWMGDRTSKWNYEALGGAVKLGVDENIAHVQPTGAYHYHGIPKLYLKELKVKSNKHSPLIGWAADGFPIYALYGYKNQKSGSIIKHKSSYRLIKDSRPEPPNGPGGKYDGSFTIDYKYEKGLGTLDECNGCFTITPDFPQGTYAYFLTEDWPVIPRNFRGNPTSLRFSTNQGPARKRPPFRR